MRNGKSENRRMKRLLASLLALVLAFTSLIITPVEVLAQDSWNDIRVPSVVNEARDIPRMPLEPFCDFAGSDVCCHLDDEAELRAWVAQRGVRRSVQPGARMGMPFFVEVFSQDGFIERVEVPIDPLQEPPTRLVPHTQFDTVRIRDNGPDTENVVITILGDGFTAGEQDDFIAAATLVANEILAFHPFSSFEDSVNVTAIKVISNESGARRDHPTDPNYRPDVDNFFHSTFWADGFTQRLLYPAHWPTGDFAGFHRVFQVVDAHTPIYDVIVLLVNTTTYGGAGGDFAVSSITPGAAGPVTIHELGHSVGNLADEYWWVEGNGGEPGALNSANRSDSSDPSTIRWRHWLNVGHSTAGVSPSYHGIFPFQEADIMNRFRPHQGCNMRWVTMDFCYVCSSELTRRIAFLSGEAFHGQSLLTNATIPEGTARILDYAFWGSEHLTTVSIPDSVMSIGRFAFLRNTSLESITNYAIIPQNINGNDRFYGVDRSNVDLFVPAGTAAAYLAAGWTGFREIIEMGAPANARLSALGVTGRDLNPAFIPGGVRGFNVSVPYEVGSIEITATAERLDATVQILFPGNTIVGPTPGTRDITQSVAGLQVGSNVITVRVTVPEGALDYTITVTRQNPHPPEIVTTDLPDGYVGVAYHYQVQAIGLPAGHTWLVDGQLPNGLTLAESTGVISGIPTTQGTSNFWIGVYVGNNRIVEQNLSITIHPAPLPPVFTSGNSTSVTAGVGGTFSVAATGDTPMTFTLEGAPAWVSINPATGEMTMTTAATATGSPFNFTIRATNAASPGGVTQAFTLTVTAVFPPVNLVSVTTPAALSATHTQAVAGTWGLPATVGIIVDPAGLPNTANVSWGAPIGFNPATITAQTVTFSGTVTLPTGVLNPNNVPLITTITVNVAAAPVVQNFVVTVNGSHATTTGAGNYAPGSTVTIHAGSRSSHNFNGWTVNAGGVALTNANSATTTFTMPVNNVTVTANWVAAGNDGNDGGGWWTPPATPSLSTPSNVRLTDTIKSWNAVNNATGYRIYVGGTFRTEVTTTSFDLATLGLPVGTHAIRVRAVYAGTRFNNSSLSATINFVVTVALPVADDEPPADDAVPLPAYQVHVNVQRQLEHEVEIAILTADEAVSDIHVYRDTLELLVEAQMPLRVVREIVWVELSVEQIEELLENMEDMDYDLVISIRILYDEEPEDGEEDDVPPAGNSNIYFVAASIKFTVGDETLQAFSDIFTLYADLSVFNLQGLNRHRIVAFHNGHIVGGNINPLTALFTVDVTTTGEFIVAYIENLMRLDMALGSPIIRDLASSASTQIMDVLPIIENGRTLVPVRFIAEALGAEVDWTPATTDSPMLVHITMDGQTLTFGLGVMTPELEALGMDVPARTIDGRTMVPLRFISEYFGALVLWDAETRSIEILLGTLSADNPIHTSSSYGTSANEFVMALREDEDEAEEVLA